MRYFSVIIIALFLLFPSILFADAEKIFRENNKGVVVIISYDSEGNPIGQGSGFVVREDGAIATNYHVISNAAEIKIKAGDKIFEVEGLLHIDKENDIVLLKADAKGLLSVKVGDISKSDVGEKVYVISSPQGLENTISDGILSGIREITSERKVLQITAPVSEGSSGGPVFNENGEVIGIATFLVKEAQNLNFAMPINFIKNKILSKKVTALKDAEIIDYKKTAEYWFNLGYYYAENGLYDDAIEAYTSAIALDPNNAQAYINRGATYVKKDQYDRAIEDFNKAIALDQSDAKSYIVRGITYYSKGQYDRTIEDCNKAIELDPNNANFYIVRGFAYIDKGKFDSFPPHKERSYYSKGQYDRAIEDFNKTIELDPNNAFAYSGWGYAYTGKGQSNEAIEDFNKAIVLNPNYADAYSGRGIAYGSKGQYDIAIEDSNKAIALNPNSAFFYIARGLIYYTKGDKKKSFLDFKKACNMGNENACKTLKGEMVLENR